MENFLAKVGDRVITQEDFNHFISGLNPQVVSRYQGPEGQKQLLQELINLELFYFYAMDEKMSEEEDFKADLERVKENFLKQYAMQKFLGSIEVSEDEVKSHYDENQDRFVTQEQVSARHILVDSEEKALEIASEIKAGKSFEDAAKEYSTCPSSQRGGDLGSFPRGAMVPEFDTAAFELEIGVVSEPVKTQFGYHLVEVTGKDEATTMSYDEVKPQIYQHLLGLRQQAEFVTHLNSLKEKFAVEINM